MSSSLKYAPYASGKVPFSINLAPLEMARWLEPDELLADELATKDRVLAENYETAVRLPPETLLAQLEVRDLVVEHLLRDHAARYRRLGHIVEIAGTDRAVAIAPDDPTPLLTAARLVQDDLVLMHKAESGWTLAAAVLTAPSKWSLVEKMNRNLDGIHDNVPGYAGRMAALMTRIFDQLQPMAPVERTNWSLYDDDVLFHPETKARPRRWSGPDGNFGLDAYVRVERQALLKLPMSGDIVFTIRVYVDPVAAFKRHPDGARMAAELAAQVEGLNEGQARYKGLLADRLRIVAALRSLVSTPT